MAPTTLSYRGCLVIEPSPRSYNTALCDDGGLLLGHLMVVAETLHYNGSGRPGETWGDLGRPEPGNQAVCGCPTPATDSQFNKVDTRDTKFQVISSQEEVLVGNWRSVFLIDNFRKAFENLI